MDNDNKITNKITFSNQNYSTREFQKLTTFFHLTTDKVLYKYEL